MSKPTPAHWKTVAVPFHTVEDGYDKPRKNAQAGPGLWQIIAASGETTAHEREIGWIRIIVAPARVAP